MDEQEKCICRVSKAGPNLFARIPDDAREKITRGDLVKIVVLEKAMPIGKDEIKSIIKELIKHNPKEKLKGTIMGYPIEIPFSRIINIMTPKKAEKFLYDMLIEK